MNAHGGTPLHEGLRRSTIDAGETMMHAMRTMQAGLALGMGYAAAIAIGALALSFVMIAACAMTMTGLFRTS